MHYETAGAGAPLVLLLPQSVGPAGRGPLIDRLALQRTVILCDWRQSKSTSPIDLRMDALADNVVQLLDNLDIRQAEFVCHSTGCGIGLALAAGHPKYISKLVLTAPWTHADTHLSRIQELRKSAAFLLNPEQYSIFNSALLFPPDFRRTHVTAFEKMANQSVLHPHDPDSITQRLDAILEFDARSLFKFVECPTLVLAARDDQLMPYWFAVEVAKQIADSEYLEFNTGGHMLLDTQTEKFVFEVFRFLNATDEID